MFRLFLILFFLLLPVVAGGQTEEHDILVLHSYHLGQAWTDGITAGMNKVLSTHPEFRLEVQYMDAKRYHDPEYLYGVLDMLLSTKLKRRSFDLVLLSDNDAFLFALRHRKTLFSGTPIVFCGINNFQPEMIGGVPGITGVAESPNFRRTLDLALAFHQHARRFIVISGTGNETDRQNRLQLLRTVPEFAGRADFVFWEDLPWEELVRRFATLDRGDLVFINALVTDREGEIVPFGEVIDVLQDLAPQVPAYSAWDFFLGQGIVGGRLVSSERQGYLAAQLALRVLAGESADEIPVITQGTNVYMFDDRELRRFGIPDKALPPGSKVVNLPPPVISLNRRETWLSLAAVVLLLGGLSSLLITLARQRRAEEALRENEERFRAIADYTYDLETWTGTDGKLKWINPSVERLTGYTPEDCMAMSDYPRPLLHECDADAVMEAYATAVRGRTAGNDFPFRIRHRKGDVRWMAVSWQPIFSKGGVYLGIRSSLRDTTERQKAENDLKAVNEELDAFVRTVSHDLRSQLTPLIGFSEFMQKEYGGKLDATGREILGQIESQGRRMHQFLEDLLSLARVEHLDLPRKPVDSLQVVREVLKALTPRLVETGVKIEVLELPPVYMPPIFLQQTMENLLRNALRYGDGSDAPIKVGGERRRGNVAFFVRDHGPGVPDSEKEKVFDLFFRGSCGQGKEGTGVGLATVRRIARRCGGEAWVEDTPGGGATFWLEVPSQPLPEFRGRGAESSGVRSPLRH